METVLSFKENNNTTLVSLLLNCLYLSTVLKIFFDWTVKYCFWRFWYM